MQLGGTFFSFRELSQQPSLLLFNKEKIIHPLFRKSSKLGIDLKQFFFFFFISILCGRGGGGEKVNKKSLTEPFKLRVAVFPVWGGGGDTFLHFIAG